MIAAATPDNREAEAARGQEPERSLLASRAFWVGGALSALFWVLVAVALRSA